MQLHHIYKHTYIHTCEHKTDARDRASKPFCTHVLDAMFADAERTARDEHYP